MSRTDVHRPYQIQLNDPYNRHLVYRYPMYSDRSGLATFKNLGCGCPLCTGRDWRRLERRVDRHVTKVLLRSGRWDEVSSKRRRYW